MSAANLERFFRDLQAPHSQGDGMTAALALLAAVAVGLAVGLPAWPLVPVWVAWQAATRSRRWVP